MGWETCIAILRIHPTVARPPPTTPGVEATLCVTGRGPRRPPPLVRCVPRKAGAMTGCSAQCPFRMNMKTVRRLAGRPMPYSNLPERKGSTGLAARAFSRPRLLELRWTAAHGGRWGGILWGEVHVWGCSGATMWSEKGLMCCDASPE